MKPELSSTQSFAHCQHNQLFTVYTSNRLLEQLTVVVEPHASPCIVSAISWLPLKRTQQILK